METGICTSLSQFRTFSMRMADLMIILWMCMCAVIPKLLFGVSIINLSRCSRTHSARNLQGLVNFVGRKAVEAD